MIAVQSLSRHFGSIKAVDDITFNVDKGEILGFLGPNGAGKSTTMKMITTFLAPTSGTASVAGFDINEQPLEVRRRIGYLPESSPSYKDMNVFDFLMFTAEIRGYDGEERLNKVKSIMETCNLKEVAFQQIDTLSKGYRQRVGFAQAFLHDPEYLILDEPTDGLDPNQKQEVRNLIKKMGQEKCIILSTHILEEVEAVCTRAIIIGEGKIVADGTPEELRSKSRLHGAITLELKGLTAEEAISSLEKVHGVDKVENLAPVVQNTAEGEENTSKDEIVKIRVFPMCGKSIAHEIATFVHDKKWNIEGFTVEKGNLNEVFYNLTKGGAA
ncbi:MAG: ABC transporter ATP-binding protein [Candidatus Rifleibacteriota bacterium]